MKKVSMSIVFSCFAALVGCGGDGDSGPSGVDSSVSFATASDAQIDAYCEWATTVPPAEPTTCSDGTELVSGEAMTKERCLNEAQIFRGCPDLTIGTAEVCMEASSADPCTFTGECFEVVGCIFSSDDFDLGS